jgi:hypothetical protein
MVAMTCVADHDVTTNGAPPPSVIVGLFAPKFVPWMVSVVPFADAFWIVWALALPGSIRTAARTPAVTNER